MQEIDHLINTLTEKYFTFCHFIVEEELQAMQLVIDVLTAISLSDREILKNIDRRDNQLEIIDRLITLARKRVAQTTGELKNTLSVSDKAIFYLATNTDFTQSEICSLTGEQSWEVEYRVSLVRSQLIKSLRAQEGHAV